MKLILLALPMLLLVDDVRGAEPTSWNSMSGLYDGSVTIIAKSGKTVKGRAQISFTANSVTFLGASYLRSDIKEVLIRQPRGPVDCGVLVLGLMPLVMLADGIREHSIEPSAIPAIILLSPFIIVPAAITGPPLLIVEGLRRLKPERVLYRVVP